MWRVIRPQSVAAPGNIIFREGKLVVIIDPSRSTIRSLKRSPRSPTKSTKYASASSNSKAAGVPYEPLPESLRRIMEDLDRPDLAQRGLTWTAQSGRRTSDVRTQTTDRWRYCSLKSNVEG